MGAFITQQPNGLYCRFSSVVDCPTHCNMTKEDYLNNVTGTVESRKEAEDVLENYLLPFSEVERRFTTLNMDQKDFNKLIKKMSEPIPVGESYHIVQSRRLFDEKRDGMKTPEQLHKEIDEHINQLRGMRDGIKLENPEMTIQTLTPTELFLLGYVDVLEQRINKASSEAISQYCIIEKLQAEIGYAYSLMSTDQRQKWAQEVHVVKPHDERGEAE